MDHAHEMLSLNKHNSPNVVLICTDSLTKQANQCLGKRSPNSAKPVCQPSYLTCKADRFLAPAVEHQNLIKSFLSSQGIPDMFMSCLWFWAYTIKHYIFVIYGLRSKLL
jgi:hypothetical protein